MNTFDEVLNYLYIINISYPPPLKVILKFDDSVNSQHFLVSKFFRSCASLLNKSPIDILPKFNNIQNREANLILTADQINFMFNNNLLPDVEIDTTTV